MIDRVTLDVFEFLVGETIVVNLQNPSEPSSPEDSTDFETEDFEEVTLQVSGVIDDRQTITVKKNFYVSWTGVKSCDHTDRIKKEVRHALSEWLEKEKAKHKGWTVLRYGAEKSSVSCWYRKDTITNKKSCGCRGGIPFYAVFQQPL